MQKRSLFITIFVVILAILGIMFFSLVSSKTVAAQLNYEGGNVLVNGQSVKESVILNEGDIIETSGDGLATVILYESVVVSLQPNTKISIDDLKKDHPQLSQEGGETWNTVTKIVGVDEYTIKSGNTVASVRGTSFVFGFERIVVLEGEVNYSIDGQEYTLTKKGSVEKVDGQIIEKVLTDEEINRLIKERVRTVEQLKILREKEIEKHPTAVKTIKKIYSLTDEDIRQNLQDADQGLVNIDEIESKSPFKVESVRKVAEMTREIIKINKEIDSASR